MVLFVAALLAGCTTHASYKNVKVQVVDFETRAPIEGVTVSTAYIKHNLFSVAATKASSGVTGKDGIVVLQGNYLKNEPALLGQAWPTSFQPCFALSIKNEAYAWDGVLEPRGGIAERSATYVPPQPDYVFELESRSSLEKAAGAPSRLLAGPVSFWPEERAVNFYPVRPNAGAMYIKPMADPNAITPNTEAKYVMARWENAAKNFPGTDDDKIAIKNAVSARLLPVGLMQDIAQNLDQNPEMKALVLKQLEALYAKINNYEYRWLRPDLVMFALPDPNRPLIEVSTQHIVRPEGYVPPWEFLICVLEKKEGTWVVLRCYPVTVARVAAVAPASDARFHAR